MKLDSGESLAYSYLRHVKKCQIVQLNWKPSGNWTATDDVFQNVFNEFERIQTHRSFIEIFKTGFDQVIKQTEIDVLGLDNQDTVYAINVAFNELGINYGSKTDTRNRVIKNLLRAHLAMNFYFPDKKYILMFCSPKVTPVTQEIIMEYFKILENDFESEKSRFIYVSNDDFRDQILMETIDCVENEFDTNELFLRAFKLLTLYAGEYEEASFEVPEEEKVEPSVVEETILIEKTPATEVINQEPVKEMPKRKLKKSRSVESVKTETLTPEIPSEDLPVAQNILQPVVEDIAPAEILPEKSSSVEMDEEKIKNEIQKVKNRVPKWFSKPDQNNSKILITFMELLEKNEKVTLAQLAEACAGMTKFTGNYAQMINLADKNHGKVLNGNPENLELWEPVRDFIIQEYIQFKKSYYNS